MKFENNPRENLPPMKTLALFYKGCPILDKEASQK